MKITSLHERGRTFTSDIHAALCFIFSQSLRHVNRKASELCKKEEKENVSFFQQHKNLSIFHFPAAAFPLLQFRQKKNKIFCSLSPARVESFEKARVFSHLSRVVKKKRKKSKLFVAPYKVSVSYGALWASKVARKTKRCKKYISLGRQVDFKPAFPMFFQKRSL